MDILVVFLTTTSFSTFASYFVSSLVANQLRTEEYMLVTFICSFIGFCLVGLTISQNVSRRRYRKSVLNVKEEA